MRLAPFRLSDARFLLILLLPAGTLLNLLRDPATVFWGALATSLVIAVVDALWPGAQRSPAPPAGPQPALGLLLRLYVPLQLVLLLAGLRAAADSDWLVVATSSALSPRTRACASAPPEARRSWWSR